jgi:hypothetical protein
MLLHSTTYWLQTNHRRYDETQLAAGEQTGAEVFEQAVNPTATEGSSQRRVNRSSSGQADAKTATPK